MNNMGLGVTVQQKCVL